MIDSVKLNRVLSGSTSLWPICYDIRKFIERLSEVFIVVDCRVGERMMEVPMWLEDFWCWVYFLLVAQWTFRFF